MFKSMMTLTYPEDAPLDGKTVKSDFNRFRGAMRREFGPFEYVWFLEFQKRGAPHLHLLTTLAMGKEKDGESNPLNWDRRAIMAFLWCRSIRLQMEDVDWVKVRNVHRHMRCWEPIRKPDGAARYISAYASKPQQKEVPEAFRNVGRFWGCSRGVRKVLHPETARGWTTEREIRDVLAYLDHRAANYSVVPKHLWGLPDLGEKLEGVDKTSGM